MSTLPSSSIKGHTEEDMTHDPMLRLALIQVLIRIGEAATNVSKKCQGKLQGIPWRNLVKARNRLVHDDDVDPSLVWRSVNEDLPRLIKELKTA